jgi:hypothetical protein
MLFSVSFAFVTAMCAYGDNKSVVHDDISKTLDCLKIVKFSGEIPSDESIASLLAYRYILFSVTNKDIDTFKQKSTYDIDYTFTQVIGGLSKHKHANIYIRLFFDKIVESDYKPLWAYGIYKYSNITTNIKKYLLMYTKKTENSNTLLKEIAGPDYIELIEYLKR